MIDGLVLLRLHETNDKIKQKIDDFIMARDTNGEFINSLNFLAYHPVGRFVDDSVIAFDEHSGNVMGVVLAAVSDDGREIVSHPGTTFAGPIISYKLEVDKAVNVLDLLLGYYEERYEKVSLRTEPVLYQEQPMGLVEYQLLQRGYAKEMMALSNIISLQGILSMNDVLNICETKRRNKIRKTMKEQRFNIERCQSVPEHVWQDINDNLYRKFQAHTVHSHEEIESLLQRCPDNIDVYCANTLDGEYGAFALNFRLKNVYHTQYLGLNYDMAVHNPNIYLLAHLILQTAQEGFKYFSFGASTERRGEYLNEGLFKYKAAYGGGTVLLPCFTKIIRVSQ